jgi:hypothetical protein
LTSGQKDTRENPVVVKIPRVQRYGIWAAQVL